MKKLPLVLSVCALSVVTFPSFAGDLNCGNNLQRGTYTGKFVKIINKDDWGRTNYEFTSGRDSGCVQVDEKNLVRSKIIYDAFLLGKEVTIWVSNTDGHYIDGISFNN